MQSVEQTSIPARTERPEDKNTDSFRVAAAEALFHHGLGGAAAAGKTQALGNHSSNSAEHLPKLELATSPMGDLASKANNAMRAKFYNQNEKAPQFYSAPPESSKILAAAWDMGQLLEATISTGSLNAKPSTYSRELNQDLRVLGKYWDPKSKTPGYDSGFGPGGDKYYDDNTWIGIAMLDAYKHDPQSHYLDRAKQVFTFQELGTKGTDKLAHPGGVFWTQQDKNFYRAAVSTAGASELGLELFQQTHEQKYLDFASKQFDWVNNNLRAPNGLFDDGMDKDGTLHKEQYSYNQGLMLGDATMLYQATGDHKYLQQAQEIAKASLTAFNGQNDHKAPFMGQMPFFNAVFFKNLMLLDSVAPDPAYRGALADYAAHLAQTVDPETGLCKIDGKVDLLDQSSAVQIFELAALNLPH